MATVEEVLSDLRSLYPKQLVLYAADLAQVLGKTEKALAHLIADKQLPFQLKKLGGKVCVDVYQLAQWLATTDEDLEKGNPANEKERSASTGNSQPRGRPSSIAARIMAFRVRAGAHITEVARSLSDPAERVFLRSVAGRLLDDVAEEARIRVTVVETDEVMTPRLSSKSFFDYEDALGFVRSFELSRESRDAAYNGRIVVRFGCNVIYEAYRVAGASWIVLDDFLTPKAPPCMQNTRSRG